MEIRTLVRLLRVANREDGLRWISDNNKRPYWNGSIHAWFSHAFAIARHAKTPGEHDIPDHIHAFLIDDKGDNQCKRYVSEKAAIDALIQALHDTGEI